MKCNVGIWHGPYEITLLPKSDYFFFQYCVWNLVNVHPTFRSSTCLASTESLMFMSGLYKTFIAFYRSFLAKLLNLARHTKSLLWQFLGNFISYFTHSITSKHIFSPSASQSSISRRVSIPLAQDSKCFTILTLGLASSNTVLPFSNNNIGSIFQSFYFLVKSILKTCPVVDVIRQKHCELKWGINALHS